MFKFQENLKRESSLNHHESKRRNCKDISER